MDNHHRKEGDESRYKLPRIIVGAIIAPIFLIIFGHLLLTEYLLRKENKRRRAQGCECFHDAIEYSPFSMPWWRWKDVQCGCGMGGRREGLRGWRDGEDGGGDGRANVERRMDDVELEDVAKCPNGGGEERGERVARSREGEEAEEIREVSTLPPAYGETREAPPVYTGPERMFAHRKESDG